MMNVMWCQRGLLQPGAPLQALLLEQAIVLEAWDARHVKPPTIHLVMLHAFLHGIQLEFPLSLMCSS